MAIQVVHLIFWLLGMFLLIGIVIVGLASFVKKDSTHYDEQFVWQRKLKE